MSAPPSGSSASAELQRLHRGIEVKTRKLELERRRLRKLIEDSSQARAELETKILPSKKQKSEQDIYREKAMTSDMAPGTAGFDIHVKEVLQSCSPGAMRSLETRITKASGILNTMNDRIREMRTNIDTLRMEKVQVYDALKNNLDQVKSTTAALGDLTSEFELDRKEAVGCQQKLSELKAADDSEKRAFRKQIGDMKKQITEIHREGQEWEVQTNRESIKQRLSARRSPRGRHRDGKPFLPSSAREGILAEYTNAVEEETFSEMNTMKRILKLALLNSIQRRHIRQHNRNSEVFEQAFRTIQQSTGVTEAGDIVKIFVKAEQENYGLGTYSNVLSRDIEDWKKENRRLKKALAMHHARVAGDAEKRQKALVQLERDIEEKKKGAESNLEVLDEIKTLLEDALSTTKEMAQVLHKERRGRGDPSQIEEHQEPRSPRKTEIQGYQAEIPGDSEVLLKYLDYIERSLSRWADAVPSVRMPPGERPFGYMMTMQMSALSPPASPSFNIPRDGTPLVPTGDLPVARLTQSAAQAAAAAHRRKSGSTIRSDCSSSDEEHFAKLDRPCTLTELKMIAKASIEKRRLRRKAKRVTLAPPRVSVDSATRRSLGYDEFVAPIASTDMNSLEEGAPAKKLRPFFTKKEREGITPKNIEKIFKSKYKLDRAQLADKLHAIRISLHDLYRLRQKFDRHDVEGSGRIRVSQLKNLLADLGEKVTAKKIEKACAELDKRKLGKARWFALPMEDDDNESSSSSSDSSHGD